MRVAQILSLLVYLLFFSSHLNGQEGGASQTTIRDELNNIFGDLDQLKEEAKATAREKWNSLSLVERAKRLLDTGQESLPRDFKISEEDAKAVIEEAKDKTPELFRFFTEHRSLLDRGTLAELEQSRDKLVLRIVDIGDAAIPLLKEKFHQSTANRNLALEAWMKMGKPAFTKLLDFLKDSLDSGKTDLSTSIMWHIRQNRSKPYTAEVIPIVTRYLVIALAMDKVPSSPTQDLLWTASFTRSKDCIPLAIEALKCKRYVNKSGRNTNGPRNSAAKLLSIFGDERGIDALTNAAQEKDGYLRYCAVGALGTCGDESVIPLLERIGRTDTYTDKTGDFCVREKARRAIEKIKKRGAMK